MVVEDFAEVIYILFNDSSFVFLDKSEWFQVVFYEVVILKVVHFLKK
jgi:hypothetical protein